MLDDLQSAYKNGHSTLTAHSGAELKKVGQKEFQKLFLKIFFSVYLKNIQYRQHETAKRYYFLIIALYYIAVGSNCYILGKIYLAL